MSDLKSIRDRIRGVKSTQQITSAMHIVAAAKLKKLKSIGDAIKLYSGIINNIMGQTCKAISVGDLEPQNDVFFSHRDDSSSRLILVVTSERGLCGSFNVNLIKKVKNDINDIIAKGKNFKLLIIGKKGYELLAKEYKQHIVHSLFDAASKGSPAERVGILTSKVAKTLLELLKDTKFNSCDIYYNSFKNALTSDINKDRIFPLSTTIDQKTKDSDENYIFEGESFLTSVIENYLNSRICYALLQSKLSEEGARMSAMNNATKNAKELLGDLTLTLNRSRQAMITNELIEIVSGAESL